ncbi:MAG: type VI secretion system tube protein Hcp [Caldimonas sp.]
MDSTTQIYLEITPKKGSVSGEARAGGYEGRIDIESFSFNAKAKADSLDGVSAKKVEVALAGEGLHNLDVNRVTVSKVFDKASLQLAGMLKGRSVGGSEREGDRFEFAKIAVDQQYIETYSTEESVKYRNEILILTLYDGCISNISLRASEAGVGAQILEEIELAFHNFEIVYYAENRTEKGVLAETWRPERWSYLTTNRTDQQA